MESGSQIGTYVAYGFVCLFLLVVAVAAARSYGMIISLFVMLFMGNTKPSENAGIITSDDNQDPDRAPGV